MTKVINFSDSDCFVSNEYLRSKKTFEHITGLDKPILESSNSTPVLIENPFSIKNKAG